MRSAASFSCACRAVLTMRAVLPCTSPTKRSICASATFSVLVTALAVLAPRALKRRLLGCARVFSRRFFRAGTLALQPARAGRGARRLQELEHRRAEERG